MTLPDPNRIVYVGDDGGFESANGTPLPTQPPQYAIYYDNHRDVVVEAPHGVLDLQTLKDLASNPVWQNAIPVR